MQIYNKFNYFMSRNFLIQHQNTKFKKMYNYFWMFMYQYWLKVSELQCANMPNRHYHHRLFILLHVL